ncbi:MAG: sigma-E processing peptidase SpoIIGA, partial [Clostridia bacterium]|nr:sigma-E processing peptidase SpoIIGA [Clostridia bacterium]
MDVLVALNWFLDYALLCGTARLLHIPCRCWRLVAGALGGALLAAALVLPVLPGWLSFFLRLGAALPVVWIAFGLGNARQFAVRMLVFFLLSTALAGLVLLIYTLAAPQGLKVINGVVYYDVS